jgi:hypothetical protein
MKSIKSLITVVAVSALVITGLLISPLANAGFAKTGTIKLNHYKAEGTFFPEITEPFRFLNSEYTKMVAFIENDSLANSYRYEITFNTNRTNNHPATSEIYTVRGESCVITFTNITENEAQFAVSDATQRGCGIDQHGNILFNPIHNP